MADTGPTLIKEFGQRIATPTIRRNGVPHQLDPIDEAIDVGKRIAAQKMIQQSVSTVETDTMRAENEKLKAEIENQQLREAKQGQSGGGANQWQEYLMSQLTALQTQVAEAQKANAEAQMAVLNERSAMLRSEIDRLRGEKPEASNPFATAREAIEQARALVEVITPATTPPPPTAGNAELEAWRIRAQNDHELRMAELEFRKEEKQRELALNQQRLDRELALQEKSNDLRDRFFTDTMPKLMNGIKDILGNFASKGAPVSEAGVAEVTPIRPDVVIPAAAPLAPGIESINCQACGAEIRYRKEWKRVTCNQCCAEYGDVPEAPATPATAESVEEVASVSDAPA